MFLLKYVPGHKCSGQMFALEVVVDRTDEGEEEELLLPEYSEHLTQEETGEVIEFTPQMTPHISLHALTGIPHFQTMRVCGHIGKYKIHILIDSGSTHDL